MAEIKQNKGEAEMSVVDWLIHYQNDLKAGDIAVCYVTSADIDAVYLHLFAVSKYWQRHDDGTYKNDMHVVWQNRCIQHNRHVVFI